MVYKTVQLLNSFSLNRELKVITQKILKRKRISFEEAIFLYQNADLPLLGVLANFIREQFNAKNTYYIKNIHIEYTNRCVNKCAFCSFRSKSENDAFEMCTDDIFEVIENKLPFGITEVHIVGGIHPENDIYFWLPILQQIKTIYPQLHIKAFTAAEIDFIITKAGLSLKEGLKMLKESGLDSIPGGGAEIFDDTIRKKLFPSKINWKKWIEIHKEAHHIGIPSNATMLYGHIENIENRIFHLEQIRALQDNTNGFNAFIPLKYKSKNNELKGITETSLVEDLKMFALSRIYLDNIRHIKSYWPMLGKEASFLSLEFGADDIDGTINNTTSIYSKAGSDEQKPTMEESEIIERLKMSGKIAIERDALYNDMKNR